MKKLAFFLLGLVALTFAIREKLRTMRVEDAFLAKEFRFVLRDRVLEDGWYYFHGAPVGDRGDSILREEYSLFRGWNLEDMYFDVRPGDTLAKKPGNNVITVSNKRGLKRYKAQIALPTD
jgi:hypothetical protein